MERELPGQRLTGKYKNERREGVDEEKASRGAADSGTELQKPQGKRGKNDSLP